MEFQRRMIEVFRGDAVLVTPNTGLLFPAWAPQINGDDHRIYEESVELPENPDVREALPRILIGVRPYPASRDQYGGGAHEGPVRVTIRSVTPKEESELADSIDAEVHTLIASTRFSNARIIAAELVPLGRPSKARIAAFNNAWEITSEFECENVAALV